MYIMSLSWMITLCVYNAFGVNYTMRAHGEVTAKTLYTHRPLPKDPRSLGPIKITELLRYTTVNSGL